MKMLRRKHDESPMPAINVPAYTADGQRVGFVKDLQGGYFQVATGDGHDFWLSRAHVTEAGDDRVDLSFAWADLGEHRLHEPGLEAEHDPDRASIRDAVLSDAELLDQRERMERELREQRGTMDTGLRE